MGIVAFFLILTIIVVVHELGHFLVARLMGIKVNAFSIGFYKLLGVKIGQTEYRIGLFPLGGYVQLDEQSMTEKSAFARLLVVSAGVVANFLFALALVWYLFASGFPALAPIIGKVEDSSPAAHAGLKPGDIMVAVDGKKILSWGEATELFFKNPNRALVVTVKRGAAKVDVTVMPKEREISNMVEKKKGGVVGIIPSGEKTYASYSLTASLGKSVRFNYEMLRLNTLGIIQMFKGGINPKDGLAGPIGIAALTNEVYRVGAQELILWTALLSLIVGFMNILPVPLLDGGFIPFLLFEMISGKKVNYTKLNPVLTAVGLTILLSLMAFAIYADISRLLGK